MHQIHIGLNGILGLCAYWTSQPKESLEELIGTIYAFFFFGLHDWGTLMSSMVDLSCLRIGNFFGNLCFPKKHLSED